MADERKQADEDEAAPDAAVAFAAKARDLEALRAAVVDAASVGAGLWFSYLFVLFYLAIAVGGVTHRDLLFENPVKLPFLNIDLPLTGFFVLGPLLFLIVHAYVLLHFVLLAGKIGAFHAELRAQIADEDARARLRRQLPSNIFVQFLAGPREVRTGVMGLLLRLIAQISLVAGPLALLVFFQLQFLPYHHEAIAWWQRLTVVADLALLWTLWPSVARGEMTRLAWRDLQRGKVVVAALASLASVLLVFTVATFPGEWLYASLPPVRFVPTRRPASEWRFMGWTSLQELLLGRPGDVDFVARKPTSLWSNRLVLPGIDVTDRAKSGSEGNIAAPTETLSLRGRRLQGAVLLDAHLRKVDFTAAELQDADLGGADLREAKFECAGVCAQLQGASLQKAQLQAASLQKAQLQGASLVKAQLQGARLDSAWLQGASLQEAQLQGASLQEAQLQGAELGSAQLQGAILASAGLQGAWLDGVKLQGAQLDGAQLQGASLLGVQLQGASIDYAELQGARLGGVNLQSASLSHIFAWRADVQDTWPRMKTKGAFVVAPETRPKYRRYCPEQVCDWSAGSFAVLKRLIEEQVPGRAQGFALERIARLDPANPQDAEEAMAKAWVDLAQSSPSLDVYEDSLAVSLRETGCDAKGAPYVIRALLWQANIGVRLTSRFTKDSRRPAELAAAFLDEAQCSGAHGLSQDDKLKLREIRDRYLPAPLTPAPTTAKE